MTQLMSGVKREDLAPAQDPDEGKRIAEEAVSRLADAYGDRLRQVVLFGSWVRGQAHEESDVDLLVVLDHVGDRTSEREGIVKALFDLEADSGRAIEAFPVAEADIRERDPSYEELAVARNLADSSFTRQAISRAYCAAFYAARAALEAGGEASP
jgi:predicted nucleotidyltransferase